ncbi:MAG: hypothetical protein JJU00_20120 [Opitutales bacterium]|nr:hypothetical protein [Opitutales bacterium]
MKTDSYFDKLLREDIPVEPFLLSDHLPDRELGASLLLKQTRPLTNREIALLVAMRLFDYENLPAQNLWETDRVPDEIRKRVDKPLLTNEDDSNISMARLTEIIIHMPLMDRSAFLTGLIHLIGLHELRKNEVRDLSLLDLKFVPRIFDACRPHDNSLALAILKLNSPTMFDFDTEEDFCLLSLLDQEVFNKEVALVLARSGHGQYFKYLPEHCCTEEFWNVALLNNGFLIESFQELPDSMKNAEMCRKVVDKMPEAVKYVPECFQTDELWMIALNNQPGLLENLPNHLVNYKICTQCVSRNGVLISSVPKDLLDESICVLAIESFQGYSAIEYIPEPMRTAEVCRRAIKAASSHGFPILNMIPRAQRTYENVLAALLTVVNLKNPQIVFSEWQCVPDSIKEKIESEHSILAQKIREKIRELN